MNVFRRRSRSLDSLCPFGPTAQRCECAGLEHWALVGTPRGFDTVSLRGHIISRTACVAVPCQTPGRSGCGNDVGGVMVVEDTLSVATAETRLLARVTHFELTTVG